MSYGAATDRPMNEAARQTQIQEAMLQLDSATTVLHKTIDDLGSRLQSISRAEVASKEGSATPRPIRVPLAEAIDSKTMAVNQAVVRLQQIISALEV